MCIRDRDGNKLRLRAGGLTASGVSRSLHMFVGSLPGAGTSHRRPGFRQCDNDHVTFERSEFLDSAEDGEMLHTVNLFTELQPQRAAA